ncbi:MAG: methylmalonyl-CoA carboxyltransferase [bacterium]|nr:methylmalonyl-CoA carboxyltransferase [bacterium]MXV90233.1 methylmalonyl-CoA carboxyltransferase [Acidimicrobiia bacterium]MYC46116.1 methylmalonyl-CoA carboxyltransferase [Acidimicrobiia bacterium]MYI19268.1 methylmalonyl-CoA carboxyltransferase [Acidimicrobiia bacterium]
MPPVDLRARARSRSHVSTAVGEVAGRQAVIVRLGADESHRAITTDAGESIRAAVELALEKRLPIVGFVAATGPDVGGGITSVHGWGIAARALVSASGVVPILLCVTGPMLSGPALLLGIADLVVMVDDGFAFVSGPAMVEQFTGVPVAAEDLGGSAVHAARSGVVSLVVPDGDAAAVAVGELLRFLPPHVDEISERLPTGDPADRATPELGDVLPASATGGYDVRAVLEAVADDGALVELRAGWAPNLVTALAAVDGYPVGMVANQPQHLAGTLDIAASQKGARFVSFCDAFNLPIVTFVDTPGFQPGKDLEWRGMIRHGAQLAFAYAAATVPRICVTLRKSYGGAYIVMDSRYMGNDMAFAWPSAEIAVMGAKGATEILHRKADPAERAALEDEYAERLLNPYRAAERGSVDAVIDPADTRTEVAEALALLSSKREEIPGNRHGNTPL